MFPCRLPAGLVGELITGTALARHSPSCIRSKDAAGAMQSAGWPLWRRCFSGPRLRPDRDWPCLTAATTASIDRGLKRRFFSDNVAHEIRMESVKPGSEALELAARMTEDGGLIQRPVAWILRDAAGEIVLRSTAPVAATLRHAWRV